MTGSREMVAMIRWGVRDRLKATSNPTMADAMEACAAEVRRLNELGEIPPDLCVDATDVLRALCESTGDDADAWIAEARAVAEEWD